MLSPALRRPLMLLQVLAPTLLFASRCTLAASAVDTAGDDVSDPTTTTLCVGNRGHRDGEYRYVDEVPIDERMWWRENPIRNNPMLYTSLNRRKSRGRGLHIFQEDVQEDVKQCEAAKILGGGFWESAAMNSSSSSTAKGWRLWTAVAAGAATALLSSAGGVGGGGLSVPIFNLLLGFDSKTSAALSSCTIVGGIFVNVFFYSFQTRHRPLQNEPLIDYSITLLFLPNLLLGISAGVICNVMSRDWLVTAAFVIAVSSMTFRTYRTAIRRWRAESVVLVPVVVQNVGGKNDAADLERPLLHADSRHRSAASLRLFPPVEIVLLAVVWLLFLAVQILRGTSDGENLLGIETCGTVYWIITSLQVPQAILLSVSAILYLARTSHLEERLAVAAREVDEALQLLPDGIPAYLPDARSMVKMLAVALAVGIVGGMLGLGGGTIVNPLFIEMGMDPQVTAATTSFMVFFSSSLSVVQYWLLGRIPEDYALAAALLALLFSAVGLQVVRSFIVRYGRVSLIVFSISTVMGISAVVMAGLGSWDISYMAPNPARPIHGLPAPLLIN